MFVCEMTVLNSFAQLQTHSLRAFERAACRGLGCAEAKGSVEFCISPPPDSRLAGGPCISLKTNKYTLQLTSPRIAGSKKKTSQCWRLSELTGRKDRTNGAEKSWGHNSEVNFFVISWFSRLAADRPVGGQGSGGDLRVRG